MIALKRKEDCCGCGACESICSKACISMREDDEGFLYPETDVAKCINCGACEKVCPVLNPHPSFSNDPKVFATQCANDALRLASSSGGLFTLLAEDVLAAGGVVFGARWNADFTEVFHDFTETLEGLATFRGSKYLQSRIGDACKKVREFLVADRRVLFTGTPCQIAGLRHFLGKDFPNLLAVDIACHSVPSPKVWRTVWADLQKQEKIVVPTAVSFREKVFDVENHSWDSSTFVVKTASGVAFSKPLYLTPFGIGFRKLLFSRPSCHECPAKGRNASDITIGNFWGIEKYFPELDPSEGVSIVICHTERGEHAFELVKPHCKILQKTSYEQATADNDGLKSELPKPPLREKFFKEFNASRTTKSAARKLRKFTEPPRSQQLRQRLRRLIRHPLRFTLEITGIRQQKRKKRIGIITLPLNENYGGILQAFATQRFLKKFGYQVLTLTIEREGEKVNFWKKAERLSRQVFRYFFPKPKAPAIDAKMTKIMCFVRENISMTEKLTSPISKRFLSKYKFDAIVVGSDQVWRRPYMTPPLTTYFLDFCGNNKTVRRVAFAASFGTDFWEFTPDETKKFSTLIKKFHAISVREDSGIELCRKFLGVHAEHLVDPTMLLARADYEKIIENDEARGFLSPHSRNSRRIFSYILDASAEKTFVENAVSEALSMNTERIMPTKEDLDLGAPFPPVSAWLRGFRDAEFVVTDSFHGCVFSIIFNKPFLAIGNAKRGMARFDSLMKMFGLENRLLLLPEEHSDSFKQQILEIVHTPIDWQEVNALRIQEQLRSKGFLENALN